MEEQVASCCHGQEVLLVVFVVVGEVIENVDEEFVG